VVSLSSRTTRWLALGLFLSLAGNLFLAGLYAGAWFGDGEGETVATDDGRNGRDGREGDEPRLLRRMIAAVPAAERPEFEAALQAHRPALIAAGVALRAARRKVGDALTAEPFDRAALEAALAESRRGYADLYKITHLAVAAAAERLSPEGRRQLAEVGQRRGRR
jgi:uncharacterized membrane protein